MRPASPAALSWLRSVVISDFASASQLSRQRPATCLRQISRARISCRYQSTTSTSASTNTREDTRPPPQTHYSFFPESLAAGPPPNGRFKVDLNSLKKEFLQLQGRAHPDRHPQSDKNKAQAMSARINEAYKTLQSPLLRAQYLLSLRGIETSEDETAKTDDPELLMEVMDAREQIEEAQSEEDLVEMKVENEARIAESEGILEEAFAKDDLEMAKRETVKLRYWINIKESLHGWEEGKPVVLQH